MRLRASEAGGTFGNFVRLSLPNGKRYGPETKRTLLMDLLTVQWAIKNLSNFVDFGLKVEPKITILTLLVPKRGPYSE